MKLPQLLIVIILLVVMVGCSENNETTKTEEPSTTMSGAIANPNPTSAEMVPNETQAPTEWGVYTDDVLVEMTLKDNAMEALFFRTHIDMPSNVMYMKEKCEAFRELMSRETAFESLERYTPLVIEKWRDSGPLGYRLNALAMAEFVGYLVPDMAELLNEIAYPSE